MSAEGEMAKVYEQAVPPPQQVNGVRQGQVHRRQPPKKVPPGTLLSAEEKALEGVTAIISFVKFGTLPGRGESPGGPAKSWATEATAISQGHRVTGPSGKSRWPGKVLGH